MKAAIRRVAEVIPIALEEIDVSTDPALEARYGIEIPVLEMDGKKVAKYRIGEQELRRVLQTRPGEAGGTG